MRTIIHDLDETYDSLFKSKCENVIWADGRYAPCQGCFGCWTKHPAQCYMKDALQMVCRLIGKTDELVIVTENYYGAYSSSVKNVLDRSNGVSTPFSTYRGKQMHHILRYGKKEKTCCIRIWLHDRRREEYVSLYGREKCHKLWIPRV